MNPYDVQLFYIIDYLIYSVKWRSSAKMTEKWLQFNTQYYKHKDQQDYTQ